MALIKAERVFGTEVVPSTFSEQVWNSGEPEKKGWRRVDQSTEVVTPDLPEVLTKKTEPDPSADAVTDIPDVTEVAVEKPVPQLDELRATAKALKIKGAHLMNAESLVKAIEKAKQK